jgi:uncharacterized repeat protein (TIGR01451 family)
MKFSKFSVFQCLKQLNYSLSHKGNSQDGKIIDRRLPLLGSSNPSRVKLLEQNKIVKSALGRQCTGIRYKNNLVKVSPAIFLIISQLGISGTAFLFAATPANAAPLSCSSIYADVNGGKQIYSLSTTTAATTLVATLLVNSNVGVAVLPGATPTIYSDSAFPIHLNYTNGTTTGNNTTATFSSSYAGGLGTDTSGRLFYIASNAGVQHLWRFNTTTSAAVDVGAITSSVAGDTIWPAMSPGDMMSDANGRLYYFGSDYQLSGGLYTNYLYYVDANMVAHRLGSYKSAQVGIGVAFDPSGIIYTLNRNLLYKIDMSAGFSATLVGDTGNSSLIDMGSCALPSMNPNVSGTKTVRDVTLNQNPATVVNTNDTLQYSTVIANTGNLSSDGSRFIDTIPLGTSYVAGSTQLCNSTGVTCTTAADVSGSAPFLGSGLLVNTPGQVAGVVLPGATNTVIVKFSVKVTSSGTPSSIANTAQITYPTVNGGLPTPNTVNTTSANVTVAVPPVTLSGTVFDDADGSKIKNGTEVGANGGGLNAVLVDSTNKVVASTAVASNGTYSFSNVPANANYTILITANTATVGSAPPAIVLPNNWVSTGENLNGTIDGTTDSQLSASVVTSNVSNANFGIEQRPTSVGSTASSQTNPGALTAVPTGVFTGSTDPDGTVASYKITAFPANASSLQINGTSYTSANFPISGVTVTAAQLSTIQVLPNVGTVTVGIFFQVIDNAGQLSSNTATANLPFTAAPVTLSGNVFDDADGSKVQNGAEVGTNGGALNAVLVNSSNKVIASTAVASNGSYSFSSVPANANYTVLITINAATVGSAPPAIILPSNWVSTGENLNGTADVPIDSKLSVSVAVSNVSNANFGIDQLPYTNNVLATAQTNPGSTVQTQVPNLSGTDPEDITLGSGASFKIVALPSNGTLYYNGIAVNAGQTIVNYDPSLFTVDPNDGSITITFNYTAIDAANQANPISAMVSIPFLQPTAASVPNLLLVKRITAINGSTQNGNVVLNLYDPDPTYPYDKNVIQAGLNPPSSDLWPDTTGATNSTFLIGTRNGGVTRPGDEIEYTINFLSAGSAPAKNTQLCDRIPVNQTFIPDGYNSLTQALGGNLTNRGIAVSYSGSYLGYTNLLDGDTAQYYAPGSDLPPVCGAAANATGAVVVNLGASATHSLGGTIPNATAPGRPTSSYGFVRFKAKVN